MSLQYPRLIDTDPVGEDQFTGGAQRRIADTIRENLDDPKFKLIGLEGPWGSGKSNVVSILRNSLESNYHFFIYDAWAHQEDLQRRSFLESLTDSLTKDDTPFNRKHWTNDLRRQLAKKKITQSIETPKVNWVVLLVIGVAALVPVTGILIEDMKLIEYSTLAQLWVALTPLLAFIAVYMVGSIKTGDWQVQKIFAFYKKHETDKTLEETINEDEPNAAVFRNWLTKIAKELTNKNKRLIIVLDNMDRLPKEKVLGFWSHLHTFFSDTKYDNINVIVPFDRTHIQLVYGFQKDGKRDGGDILGDANYYINKTFPLVFAVPTTVFTDWKDFFNIKYKEAFGNEYIEDMENVRIIFDRFNNDGTPRDLITYINEIVSLCLVWKEEIPIKYLALYAATRKDFFPHKLASLLEGKYADSVSNIFNGDEKLLGFMAQLLYNIPKENAQEVILYRETMSAIHEEKQDYLLKLSTEKNFITVLGQLFVNHVSISRLTSALFALDNAKSPEERILFQPIWRQIIRRKAHTEKHANEFSDTEKILLLKANETGLMDLMGNHVCQLLTSIQGQESRSYAKAMIEFDTFVKEKKLPFNVSERAVARSLYGSEYIDFVDEAKDKWDQFKVTTGTLDLDSRLADMIPRDIHKVPVGPYLRAFKLDRLVERIKQAIADGTEVTIENTVGLYQIYRAVSPAGAQLQHLSKERLDFLIVSEDIPTETKAILLLMRLQLGTDLGSTYHQVLVTEENPDYIDDLLEWRESFISLSSLIKIATENRRSTLTLMLQTLVKRMHIGSDEPDYVEMIRLTPKLIKEIAIDPTDWVAFLEIGREQFIRQIEADDLASLAAASTAEFFINNPSAISSIVLKKMLVQLQAINQHQWTEHFTATADTAREVLCQLVRFHPSTPLSENVSDGLCSALPQLTQQWNDRDFEMEREYFEPLMDAIDSEKLKKSLRETLEQQIKADHIPPAEFLFFEKSFREHKIVDYAHEAILNHFIVENIQDQGVTNVLMENKDFYISLFKYAPEASTQLIQELRKMIEDENYESNKKNIIGFLAQISLQTFGPIEIIEASYSTAVEKSDPLALKEKLQQMAKDGHIYHFPVVNGWLDVSGPDYVGLLKIKFRYQGEEVEVQFSNGQWVRFTGTSK